MDVTICVATFGNRRWAELAQRRAIPSAQRQSVPVVAVHGRTLAAARTACAQQATTEWLIHLDADDTLTGGYVDAMSEATGDLRAPALVEVHGTTERPVDLTGRDIEQMNPCCIGTAIRRDMVLDIGWSDWPAWEDWALFLTAARRGAVIEHVPGAVYRATVSAGSRNRRVPNPLQLHAAIRAAA